jgi:hypothetical protein
MGREMQTPGMADLAASFHLNPTTHLALMFSSRYRYSSLKTPNNKEQETPKKIQSRHKPVQKPKRVDFSMQPAIPSSVFRPQDPQRQRTRNKTAKAVTK